MSKVLQRHLFILDQALAGRKSAPELHEKVRDCLDNSLSVGMRSIQRDLVIFKEIAPKLFTD